MSVVECAFGGRCGGCPWIGRPYAEQVSDRRQALGRVLSACGLDAGLAERAPVASVGEAGLRTRLDLAFRRIDGVPHLGFWSLDRTALVDITDCPAAEPALEAWLRDFRGAPPPIDRMSVRLRVAPDGTRGVWLDAANVDIKALLDERAWLAALSAGAVVELGQRRKRLVERDGQLKLGDPELRPWARTWLGDQPAPLYLPVGGFSQPGDRPNRALVAEVVRLAGPGRTLELGAGCGNLTLPLAHAGAEVLAVELDPLAVQGLRRSAAETGLEPAIRVVQESFLGSRAAPMFQGIDRLVADPPRSGLGAALDGVASLEPAARPGAILYISCFLPALERDLPRLTALGYRVDALTGVDQFPQTPHLEWLVSLIR